MRNQQQIPSLSRTNGTYNGTTDVDTDREIDEIVCEILDDSTYVTMQLPTSMYIELQRMATFHQCSPLDIVARMVAQHIHSVHTRKEALTQLVESIQAQGGLDVPDDEEAFWEHMRKTRQEIYDEEYAHLYDHLYR